jgi:hypothetical protein
MKVILNYDEATGQITDMTGAPIFIWVGLIYEPVPEQVNTSSQIDGEQLIRIMKLSAHVDNPEAVKDI